MVDVKKSTKSTDKAANFKRLATFRAGKALKAMRQLSALANKATYDYTDAQVATLVNALNAEIAAIKDAFQKGGRSTANFTL